MGLVEPQDLMGSVRKEMDDVLADMRNFYRSEPDEVMSAVSAHSARLAEIVVGARRVEAVQKQWRPIREEAEFILGCLKDQFMIASRQIAVRRLDQEMI